MTETWWEALYDDALADVLLERADPGAVDAVVAWLVNVLGIAPGDAVFDQCCGIGSLSVPLARAGMHVVGVDLIEGYVARARAAAAGLDPAPRFVAGDAFTFVPDAACDAAINWWTSFGYAASDDENLEMLRRAAEALRPGGRFALDFLNLPGLYRHFRASRTLSRQTPTGEVTLVREAAADLGAGILETAWRFRLPGGEEKVTRTRVRLYAPDVLARLLARAGFEEVALFGSAAGDALTLDSPRCIAVARKAAA